VWETLGYFHPSYAGLLIRSLYVPGKFCKRPFGHRHLRSFCIFKQTALNFAAATACYLRKTSKLQCIEIKSLVLKQQQMSFPNYAGQH